MKKRFMRLAIQEAKRNFKDMQGGPFGACIVKNDKILAIARNSVLKKDPTAHAEINAIRLAAKKLNSYDLSGCVIYSTTEPCPMCFSAIHWARIDTIVYGTGIADVKRRGFNELAISNIKMKTLGKSKVKVSANFLQDECRGLLEEWDKLESKAVY
jgi:tRNA(Arg) A34 adenosine deaminase TadA